MNEDPAVLVQTKMERMIPVREIFQFVANENGWLDMEICQCLLHDWFIITV